MGWMAWTPDEDEWLREFYPVLTNPELAAMKAEDGWPRSADAIMHRAKKLGLRKDEAAGYRKVMPSRVWTDERVAWFRAFVPGHTESEIGAEHERIFGTPLSASQIGNAKSKFGVRSGTPGNRYPKGNVPFNKGKTWDDMGIGEEARERIRRTQFKRGGIPHNARPLLDTRVTKDGRTEIHVGIMRRHKANDQWIPLAQFVWMQHNGRDWPDGHRALFADHDNTNYDPDNIVPVPNDLWPLVMGANLSSLPYHDRATLETAILSAKVTRARTAARKRGKAARKESG